MLQSRWLYVFVGIVLVIAAGLTYRAALATNVVADHSYDTVEAARLSRSDVDRSYDAVEAVRVARGAPSLDHSYNSIALWRAWEIAGSH